MRDERLINNRRLTSVEDRAILDPSRIFSKMAAPGSPS